MKKDCLERLQDSNKQLNVQTDGISLLEEEYC